MADYVELFMDRGADFSTTIAINDDSTNAPQNLMGYIVTSQMRKSLISINATANLVCSIPSPNTGEIFIEMSSANTANISPGTYFFDVRTRNVLGGNGVSRLVEGIIIVSPSITR
jgi:hypothetical protein